MTNKKGVKLVREKNGNIHDSDSIDMIKILSQKKEIIMLSVVICLAGAFIMTVFFISPMYQVNTKVLVKKELIDKLNVLPFYDQDAVFVKNQAELISSKPIIEKALNKVISSRDLKVNKKTLSRDIERIKRNIEVEVLRNTSVISLTLNHPDRTTISPLVNAMAEEYIQANNKNKAELIDNALFAIDKQLDSSKIQLNNAELTMSKYLNDKDVAILPESEMVLSLRRFSNFDFEVARASAELKSANTELLTLSSVIRASKPEDMSLHFLLNSSVLKDYRDKIQIAKIKLSDMQGKYTAQHPDIVSLKTIITRLQEDMATGKVGIIKAEIEAINIEKKLAESKLQVLLEEKMIQGGELKQTLALQPKLFSLMNAVKSKRNMYNDLLEQKADLEIFSQRAKMSSDLKVLEPAITPTMPISPNMLINLLLGALCGLTFGLAIAIMSPLTQDDRVVLKHKKAEKRLSERYQAGNKVNYVISGEKLIKHACYTKDISKFGMSIVSDDPLEQDSVLKFQIDNSQKNLIDGHGVVVWSSSVPVKGKQSKYISGVKFDDIKLNINKNKS